MPFGKPAAPLTEEDMAIILQSIMRDAEKPVVHPTIGHTPCVVVGMLIDERNEMPRWNRFGSLKIGGVDYRDLGGGACKPHAWGEADLGVIECAICRTRRYVRD